MTLDLNGRRGSAVGMNDRNTAKFAGICLVLVVVYRLFAVRWFLLFFARYKLTR
jgi:hypothetical protein